MFLVFSLDIFALLKNIYCLLEWDNNVLNPSTYMVLHTSVYGHGQLQSILYRVKRISTRVESISTDKMRWAIEQNDINCSIITNTITLSYLIYVYIIPKVLVHKVSIDLFCGNLFQKLLTTIYKNLLFIVLLKVVLTTIHTNKIFLFVPISVLAILFSPNLVLFYRKTCIFLSAWSQMNSDLRSCTYAQHWVYIQRKPYALKNYTQTLNNAVWWMLYISAQA